MSDCGFNPRGTQWISAALGATDLWPPSYTSTDQMKPPFKWVPPIESACRDFVLHRSFTTRPDWSVAKSPGQAVLPIFNCLGHSTINTSFSFLSVAKPFHTLICLAAVTPVPLHRDGQWCWHIGDFSFTHFILVFLKIVLVLPLKPLFASYLF